jgi:hypothetical protein
MHLVLVIASVLVVVAATTGYEECTLRGITLPVPSGSQRCAQLKSVTGGFDLVLSMTQMWLLADIKDALNKICVRQGAPNYWEYC